MYYVSYKNRPVNKVKVNNRLLFLDLIQDISALCGQNVGIFFYDNSDGI